MTLWLDDLHGMKQYRDALLALSCRRPAPVARADQAPARPERRPASAVTFRSFRLGRVGPACPALRWADGDEPATVAPPSPAQPPGAALILCPFGVCAAATGEARARASGDFHVAKGSISRPRLH